MADPTPTPPAAPTWVQKYGPWILKAVVIIAAMVIGAVTHQQIAPPVVQLVQTPPAEEPQPAAALPPAEGPGPFGWHDDPEEVAAVQATMPIKGFQFTPAFAADPPEHAYLWEAALKATGQHIPARNQGQVGSCVSFGAACAVEYLECVQIAGGHPELFKPIAQEVIYGGSRVQIGRDVYHSNLYRQGDGSVGGWAAKWCQDYGAVARGTYGSVDLTGYSESRCRQYGSKGCPDALVPVARLTPVKSVTQVRTVDEARKALASGYPVTVASNVGFGMRGPYTRDQDGFLRASGTWPHQMCFVGYRTAGRSGFYCMNSWGQDWVSGPTGPGNPPPGGFWVDDSTVARMLGQGDSWAYSDLTGFPARKPKWFVSEPRRRPAPELDFTRAEAMLAP